MSCESMHSPPEKKKKLHPLKGATWGTTILAYVMLGIIFLDMVGTSLPVEDVGKFFVNSMRQSQTRGKQNWKQLQGNDGKFWEGTPDDSIYGSMEGIECREYYEYRYDEEGRLSQVDTYRRHDYYPDTWVLSEQEVYLYDEEGRILSRNSSYRHTWDYVYSAEGWTATYQYSSSEEKDTYTYDKQGNLTASREAILYRYPHEYQYVYDEKNRKTKTILAIDGGEPFVEQRIEYHDEENTALEKTYFSDGELSRSKIYKYDYYNGFLMDELICEKGYQIMDNTDYHVNDYDAEGNCVLELDIYNFASKGAFHMYRYVFDEQGRKTEGYYYNCSEAENFEYKLTDGSSLLVSRDVDGDGEEFFCATRTASDGEVINEFSPRVWLFADEESIPIEDMEVIQGDKEDSRENCYVVRPGDTLWQIAERYLGEGYAYMEIYRENRNTIGEDPDLILPGMELYLEQ